MGHEKSITIKSKKGIVNAKSVHGGKQLKTKTIRKWIDDGHLKPLGGKTFKTFKKAVSAAKARSKNFKGDSLLKEKK